MDETSQIPVRVHTEDPGGVPADAFYLFGDQEWVSFNLETAQRNVEMAQRGDITAIARLLEVSAHELEHGKRKDGNGESPFCHTQDFYESVQRNILSVPTAELMTLM